MRKSIVLFLTIIFLAACGSLPGQSQPKVYRIGVLSPSEPTYDVVTNFQAEMAKLGYTDKNLTYVIKKFDIPSVDLGKSGIKDLASEKVDMVFAVTSPVARGAKQATEGTDLPILFAPGGDPVQNGLVKNMANPGENLTGIAVGVEWPAHLLEYLIHISPKAKKVFVMYDTQSLGAAFIPALKDASAKIGIELVLQVISTEDSVTAAVKNLPSDIDAILMVPEPVLYNHIDEISKAAITRKIPFLVTDNTLMDSALLGYSWEYPSLGRQAARLADKILKGEKPGTIPVETADFMLSVNLKTAAAIGMNIDDSTLRQAAAIIRVDQK